MNTTTQDRHLRVIKLVQELLLDDDDRAAVTPMVIGEKLDLVLRMHPRWNEDLNRQAVIDELIRRFSLWIGQDTTLSSGAGHVAWLTAARKQDWRYWQRYREMLERKLSYTAVEALDRSTDRILGLLEDPARDGPWDRRGLVVGHVQSGKTSSYTALIGKAADAGYKIVIVLAGLHNNLRSQTQIRLDEGFLGYETRPAGEELRPIGVGEIDGDPKIRPNYATNRSENGDFSTAVARNLGITPEQRPWLFVVKKNKTVLNRLLGWIRNHVANATDATGRRVVTNLPLLLIDDEADHASVDTGEQSFGEDGKPDEDHQPTAINRGIRRILNSFTRSAYVGYTATPFANIFIHERNETPEDGPDLFPSAFIVNLAAPSNYVGPARVFGRPGPQGREGGLDLARPVSDHTGENDRGGWMPSGHKSSHVPFCAGPDGVPDSLVEAVDDFLLACAVRRLRGQGAEHCSMLVHVTRFNAVQEHVFRQIDACLRHIRQRLVRRTAGFDVLELRLRRRYESEHIPTTEAVARRLPEDVPDLRPAWDEVLQAMTDVIEDIQVRTINGTAKDALNYEENRETGLKVIAIGGDKLARGLTLEGLCVSYFLRASRMYDTLMQMGRWFGYRPGYIDLCRLYTTDELVEWFGHITDASEELREEFELMASSGGTPRDYGLRVQSHPVLMVTSRLKMRSARNLMLSFSGRVIETVVLFRDRDRLQRNLGAGRELLSRLGNPLPAQQDRPDGQARWNGHLWRVATHTDIIEFLSTYRTHPEAMMARAELLAEFVGSMAAGGELREWTVALIGSGDGEESVDLGVSVGMLKRRRESEAHDMSKYAIGRLLSPRDESIDMDCRAWSAALAVTRDAWHTDPARPGKSATEPELPSGPAMRKLRGEGAEGVPATPNRGLLLLYLLDPVRSEIATQEQRLPPVLAFGMSFPGSRSGRKVEYKVNNVFWEQEYGASE